jgi:CO dehydrogenase maturation factor
LNAVVREFLKIYTPEDNEILLIDTEAGIEHIGRGNEKYVDAMVIVVDPSYESLELSTRAKKLALESDISNKRIHIIINKADDNIYKILVEGLKERELESYVSGSVRFDPYILEASMLGRPIIGYGGDVSRDIENILNRIIEK